MSCREVTELSSDYLEGKLSTPARLRVRIHLLMCNACQRYVAQLRAIVRALGSLGMPEQPSDDVLRVLHDYRESLRRTDMS
jgi:anti-sigma factor RsiW